MAADRKFTWDVSLPGFGLQRTKTGHESYVFQYRAGSVSRRMKLDGGWFRHEAQRSGKAAPAMKGTARAVARREAEAVRGAIAQGRDPLAEMRHSESADKNTFKAIAEQYLARDGSRLRSKDQIKSVLERHAYPRIGRKPIDSIKRSEITRMLDKVEEEAGPVAADRTLAHVRKICNWAASRSDDFNSPIVRGMARIKPKERARTRTLTDDELRAIWKTAEAADGPFPGLVRFLLLTAARRNEAAAMTWAEVDGSDWTLPASRNKAKADLIRPLSKAAQATLKSRPRIKGNPHVFTTGRESLSGFSKFKREFDEACGVTGWTLHDLRRTARSLMSRAGVNSDHAERCLGHVIGGVKGIYDRHAYHAEMGLAYEKLAALIESIVDPQENVVSLRR